MWYYQDHTYCHLIVGHTESSKEAHPGILNIYKQEGNNTQEAQGLSQDDSGHGCIGTEHTSTQLEGRQHGTSMCRPNSKGNTRLYKSKDWNILLDTATRVFQKQDNN